MRYLLWACIFFFNFSLRAQVEPIPPSQPADTVNGFQKLLNKSVQKSKKPKDSTGITIKDYKIISYSRDTTYLDTTLTIKKQYKHNYLRKDYFELLPLGNIGQPYNKLGLDYGSTSAYPLLGAQARQANYMRAEDIDYYHVATPMTELMYKTTFEEGQLLDALLTANTSKQLNLSLAYKGFRSLGKYSYSQAQSGNFRATANYLTKDQRYNIRFHFAAQQIKNEENGGLLKPEQFASGDPEFKDRSRIDVILTDARNRVSGKRYFLEHNYKLFGEKKDSNSVRPPNLTIGHIFNYESKYYEFSEDGQNDYFGPVFIDAINDKAALKAFYNQLNARFSNRVIGNIKGYVDFYNYDYFFNSEIITDTQTIESQLKGNEISVGGQYDKQIGKLGIQGEAKSRIKGNLSGNLVRGSLDFALNGKNKVSLAGHIAERMPDFNFLLYQSDYRNYNWQNDSSFKKQRENGLQADISSTLLGSLSMAYTTLQNYSYFASTATEEQIVAGTENALVKPFQESGTINYFKATYRKEFRLGDFALDNTLMYQHVSQAKEVMNLPRFVTRNTLYYQKEVFRKAMFLQTGVTFKYFTEYYMDSYNPLLGEFYIQNREQLGGYPLLDFFIDAKVRNARIFFKLEHFNAAFTGYNYYSAPNYPYRDFVIRFGLVWNFFS
ncbi:putative porin [Flavobacteriaceae bacterium F89]|uniref:Porin n=1 Tax=Cerina litoralis TaxID=2874477 RepID=A0AAE3EWZ8_9FLAO|nr:putative porin [Cerina litoralis]MCG2462635.1 putative porin [Cerina litoralis]